MAVLSYLSTLKRGLRLAFGEHFLHDFSLLNTLPIDKVQCHIFFPSQDQKKWVKFLFRLLLTSHRSS